MVIEGHMTVNRRRRRDRVGPDGSCTIPPGEVREIINRTNTVCKMLVVIPFRRE